MRSGSLSSSARFGEAGHVGLEGELDGAGGAVALLADDHLGLAVDLVHLGLPLEVLSVPGFGSLFLR
jgi:hypothetical protein